MRHMAFWYNVSTKQVETDDNRAKSADLLGPYATRAQAEAALQVAHEKTERADAADRKWNDDDD